ncbi:MAG: hypothetical protein ACOCSH_01690 [Candidatus Hadarchaeota archaeon]
MVEDKGRYRNFNLPGSEDALERLQDGYYDVVVSVCQMPEMNGLMFLKGVRERTYKVFLRPLLQG